MGRATDKKGERDILLNIFHQIYSFEPRSVPPFPTLRIFIELQLMNVQSRPNTPIIQKI